MEAVMSSVEFRIQRDQDPHNGSSAASSSSTSAVFRKIGFHPARKPFNGFSNGSSDFKIETLNPGSSNKRHATVTPLKRPDGSDFWETGMDPDLSFGVTFRKIGAGLENLGNTCFLNSVLQCLTYTEPLAAYLQSAAHQKSCHVSGFCALCAIQKHVRTALQATGRILAPKDLVSNLRCISRNFRNCRQEDAHEYMINLLECMHKCCLPSGVPTESLDAYKSSLVHRIFGGRLRSQVKCTQCSHCSDTFDPFLDLSLDIARADSLQKALSHFTAVELLDDGAKIYQCERCKQKVKAVKQLTVSKAPYVLTVHFKRFEAHRSEKIDKKVQFYPTVNMKPFVSDSYEGDLKYTLYGVLVHYGRSIHSGHYACFIRTSSGLWYSLDDNRVKQVAERTVFEQKAYMLFYVLDRRYVVPKNAAAIVLKESPRGIIAANRASSLFPANSRQENVAAVVKSCGVDASADRSQKDTESILTARGTLQKEAPSLRTNDGVMAISFLERGDSEGKYTASKISPGKTLKPVSPFLNRSTNDKNHGNMPTSGVMFGNCIKEKDSVIKVNSSVDVSSPDSLSHETSHKVNLPSVSIPLNVTKIGDPDSKTSMEASADVASAGNSSKNAGLAKHPKEPGCDNSQVEAVTSGNSMNKKTVLNYQNLAQRSATICDMSTESVKTSTCDGVTFISLRKTHKPHMRSMYMGLKFFKLTLGLHKKKKHKWAKLRTSRIKNISEELLSQRRAADQDPSTSQPASRASSGSTCLPEKYNSLSAQDAEKSGTNGVVLMDAAIIELRERTNKDGSLLASKKQSSGHTNVLEASQQAKRKRDSSKDKPVGSEKAALSILTRGLPETTVAKWDDRELTSQITGSKCEDVSIGYVADEWDEEYDRGKRKKIKRNKVEMGGRNEFQLLASKKFKGSERKANSLHSAQTVKRRERTWRENKKI